MMFKRLLIANRGEIACRVIATAKSMGLTTVAVYSDADRGAPHVRAADESAYLGPSPAGESYLRQDLLLDLCRKLDIEALHPGYGFLSENADFAEACTALGLIFVGPPAAAIRAMGEKARAKELMAAAGIPLIPGYNGEDQGEESLVLAAAELGYPLMIKASAGGGGRGMRPVFSAAECRAQLAAAKREARAAFGDDRVLLEALLPAPRHIEVQVFADSHGNCVHLFERDCSIQRRHQKIVEEAPAPGLPAEKRRAMARMAVRAAKTVHYVGAGTVEFLFAAGDFYYMEMNTRLQVEHPVTEMITGTDLVEWQLRVAAGEPLPLTQEQITGNGHAIEVRVCCEDANRGFLPVSGMLRHVRFPLGKGVRVDSGVESGFEVSAFYDSMIAKIIAWGVDRGQAIRRLQHALGETELDGPVTNIGLLAAIIRDPEFGMGGTSTDYLRADRVKSLASPPPCPDWVWAALAVLLLEDSVAAANSPWSGRHGFQLNAPSEFALCVHVGVESRILSLAPSADSWEVCTAGRSLHLERPERLQEGGYEVEADGRRRRLRLHPAPSGFVLFQHGWSLPVRLSTLDGREFSADAVAPGSLTAPMPGQLISIQVAVGDQVQAGQQLAALEAMKMEHILVAPMAGRISAVRFQPGDRVAEGAEIVAMSAASD